MFKISSEAELLNCFRATDREEVVVPADLHYPILVKTYFTWMEDGAFRNRVYLLFSESSGTHPMGIVFRRDQSAGGEHPAMCGWCHSVRTGGAVRLLTAAASRDRRVGVLVCSDLSCGENAKSDPGIHDFAESLSERDRIRRIIERMADFARRELY